MHKNVLSDSQLNLLPLLKSFSNEFYLVGGTAIALHLGHRKSIDFDLFTQVSLNQDKIFRKIEGQGFEVDQVIYSDGEQIHLLVNEVKITFFNYKYQIEHKEDFEDIITLPDLLSLGAMKALALGGRAKWKDYVDIYFLLHKGFELDEIINKAKELFGTHFNGKLFREQISYFEDIDYTEKVDYVGNGPSDDEVKVFLRGLIEDVNL